MGDWCECRKPDFPEVYDKDYLTTPGVCRVCGKKRNPYEKKQPPTELLGSCPEGHTLKHVEVKFAKDFKGYIIHYISGYCEKCNKVFCIGDDMTQLGVGI